MVKKQDYFRKQRENVTHLRLGFKFSPCRGSFLFAVTLLEEVGISGKQSWGKGRAIYQLDTRLHPTQAGWNHFEKMR